MRHWASSFFDEEALAPQPHDEEFFLTIELLGVENLPVYDPQPRVYNGTDVQRRMQIEAFCRTHHKDGPKVTTGIWVRYEIWRSSRA